MDYYGHIILYIFHFLVGCKIGLLSTITYPLHSLENIYSLLFLGQWSRQGTPDWDEGDASLPPRTSRRHNDERRRVADEEETVLDAAETGSVGSLDRGQ